MRWSVDAALSGRELRHVALAPGARVAAPGPCSVVALVCGTATLGGRPLGIAVAPGREIVAGPLGCTAAAICWQGEPPTEAAAVESTDSRYFGK
jgi:hypothetical protein